MNKFGLLGKKLGHSYSCEIHSYLADYEYKLYEKNEDELDWFMKNFPLDGMNVTIPYKKDVIKYCDTLSDTAKKTGSVNTISVKDGKMQGYNTDYYGFMYMMNKGGIDVNGKKVLLLGSGGASQTLRVCLKDMGAREVIIISRGGENNYGNLNLHADAEIIVNSTPVGMYPNVGVSPVDITLFPNLEGVADIIYNPSRTKLLLDAEKLKIPCINGLSMLVAQAKQAYEIFTGSVADNAVIDKITDSMAKKMRNIILIGMPGCGKSSIGKIIAQQCNREFADCDEQIEIFAKKSIRQIFEESGEDGFRKIETEVLSRLCKKSGLVISTGGGCVTQKQNYDILHQNGVIVWVERDIGLLTDENRPLSEKFGVETLYKQRKKMYADFADAAVSNNGAVFDAVNKIMEAVL